MKIDSLAFEAMKFARKVHIDQRRKYTNNPYVDHLAEVAGIVATVNPNPIVIATAWLHDSIEDQDVSEAELAEMFGVPVAYGVRTLSDLEEGNRATRKAASRQRLSEAPSWVQTIKCADLISNTSSIVMHDPDFAAIYLEEKRLLLSVLTQADRKLWDLAWSMANV